MAMKEFEIKQEAYELRREFGLSATEPIRFKSLLLKEGILTHFSPLEDNFSGMAIKANGRKFILINSLHPIGRQHFTICHELFHLYIDKNFETHRCQTALFNKKNKSEYEADSFASHFLLPEQGLFAVIPKGERKKNSITLSSIIKIEHYYACSRRAIANRLMFLSLITTEYRDELCQNVKMTAQLHGYPVGLYNPGNDGELWGSYGSLAKLLFDNEKISEGHYASLMDDIGIDIFKNFEENGD